MEDRISAVIKMQRDFFESGATLDVEMRLSEMRKLRQMILSHQTEICQALYTDLHKSAQESYLTEIRTVLDDLEYQISHLVKWSKPHQVAASFFSLQGKSFIHYQPYGLTLIIAPWNYPFFLLISPLIGAMAAGNCAILKPAPQSVALSGLLAKLIGEYFPERYIAIFEGHSDVNKALLTHKYDYIFFTGGPGFGKYVAQCAASRLTPVTLELGGKSPCIVDRDADIELAARRIVWGKLLNAGQTCIAPDYLLIHKVIRNELITRIEKYITQFYGEDVAQCEYYPRIITPQATTRLIGLIQTNRPSIIYGGAFDETQKFIAPTLFENPPLDGELMTDEIFGPLLPVITFEDTDEAIRFINNRPKPLALYYFGKKDKARRFLNNTSSGGMCINDVLLHITNHNLPFGGVGNSGMGRYHGFESFKTFSNPRGVYEAYPFSDLKFRYPPFKIPQIIKRFL